MILAQKPDTYTFLITKAIIQFQLGNITEANKLIDRIESRIQGFELRYDPALSYFLGRIRWEAGDEEKANYYFSFISSVNDPSGHSQNYKNKIDMLLTKSHLTSN
jgi:hypothetical protein